MDWSRAKSILIVLFLALNLTLFSTLAFDGYEGGVSAADIDNTLQVLKDKNIIIDTGIPDFSKDMGKLIYSDEPMDHGKLIQTLLDKSVWDGKPIEIDLSYTFGNRTLAFQTKDSFIYKDQSPTNSLSSLKKETAEAFVKDHIKSLDIPIKEFIVSEYTLEEGGSVHMVMIQRYKGFYIFDNRIEIEVTNQGIRQMYCSYREIKNISRSKKKIIPAHIILLRNFNSTQPRTIQSIQIGYISNKREDVKTRYEGSVWCIKTKEDPHPLYYKALSEYGGEPLDL